MFFTAEFLQELEHLALWQRRRRGRGGDDFSSAHRGSALEFSAYRAYSVGDDLRFVDWNIYARLEQLVTKIFTLDETQCVKILIDNSVRMTDKFIAVAHLAAVMVYLSLANGNRLQIQTLDENGEPHYTEIVKGKNSLHKIYNFLAALKLAHNFAPDKLSAAYRNLSRRGNELRIILSDFLQVGGCGNMIADLSRRGVDLYAIQILSPTEIAPKFYGAVNLHSRENNERLKLDSEKKMLLAYQMVLESYCADLQQICQKYDAQYWRFNAEIPVREMILQIIG